jgi:hypothetical protein
VATDLERAVAEAALRRDARVRRGTHWRRRGIVHTPWELARHGAARVDDTLRRMGLPHGLADPRVALVDPACGPGAFLAAALAVGHGPGPRWLVGMDREARALGDAQALLGAEASRRGWPLTLARRDTLRCRSPWPAPLAPDGVAVVMGNPPWAVGAGEGRPRLTEAWMADFLRDGEGRALGERRVGALRDAYVHFWRWAAEVARQGPAGGVVLLVTNGSFLEGPVHRGMRRALLSWFDGIEVLDLGGNTLVARPGRPDDNVFQVRTQVALTLAWRGGAGARGLHYGRLWGRRAHKLRALAQDGPEATARVPVTPLAPAFVWVPAQGDPWPADAIPLATLMPFHREGVQTNRDAVATDACRDRLLARLEAFVAGRPAPGLEPALTPSRHYDPEVAREAVRQALAAEADGALRRVAYRPFVTRWLAPIPPFCHRPRPALLRAVDASDRVLLTVRKDRGHQPWSHFGAVRDVPDNCWLSTRSSCRTRAFPSHGPDGAPNLCPDALHAWETRIAAPIHVHDLMAYALAHLAAPTYREAFGGALRSDYPRLLPPPDAPTWVRMLAAGQALFDAFDGGVINDVATPPLTLGHWEVPAPPPLRAAVAAAGEAFDALRTRIRKQNGSQAPHRAPPT